MTLDDLGTGQSAIIDSTGGEERLRRHLLDMGFVPGAEVKLLRRAPLGDPVEVMLQGYTLSLRRSEAADVKVSAVGTGSARSFSSAAQTDQDMDHPGLGEAGKYHSKDHEDPLPKGAKMTIAIAGQQNSGKTTLYNAITDSSLHVGNFPGVTVESQESPVPAYPDVILADLPGICSLTPYSSDESLARDYIIDHRPEAIINIVDANNIERHLYLTMQLMELEIPIVLALNMMDEVNSGGGTVRVNEMEHYLGIPVVPIAASKGVGVTELMDHAVHVARYQEKPARQDFCDADEHGGAVHKCLHSIMHLVEGRAREAGLPVRYAASRLIEGDSDTLRRLALTDSERETLEMIILEMEKERGLDRYAAMADMRFSFISRLCSHTVVKEQESKEQKRSNAIDRILTGKWTAVPSFIAIIGLVFWITFDKLGYWLQELLAGAIAALGESVNAAFIRWEVSDAVRSLVVDAIFGGVGTVLGFVPIIIVLFFFLSLLEDSGYMARVAFISDKLLRKIGLSGRSIVPMLISFGCSVPGVMATRTLPSARDRKLTVLLIPFMSCSAKIAIYGFLTSAFFPGHAGLIMVGLYLLGILLGIATAFVRKLFGHHSDAAPFIMEMPTYRLPKAKNAWHLLWNKTKDFLQMAFSVVLIATIIIWILRSFDFGLNLVDPEGSMLAWLSGKIAPLFAPLGLGDWRIVTALISGLLAKESIVSTMTVLGASSALTAVTAVPMLVFCLLYTPCVAAIAAIRRELGPGWAAFVVVFQCVIAWLCAWAAFLIVA